MYIYISKEVHIGLANDLVLSWQQAIMWTKAVLLVIGL